MSRGLGDVYKRQVYPIISRRDFTSIRAYGEIHRTPVRTNRIAIKRNSHKYFAFIAAPRITVVIAAEQVFIRFGQSMIRPGIVPSDYFFTLLSKSLSFEMLIEKIKAKDISIDDIESQDLAKLEAELDEEDDDPNFERGLVH